MSFIKQLLKPFVEFDEQKEMPPAKENKPAAVATPPTSVAPVIPPVNENAAHPLVTGMSNPVPVVTPVSKYFSTDKASGPLPEHVQYFERLIEEANAKNPLFHGPDYKEFVDSKMDIDDISDEALKYRTAYNILKSAGLTKEKLMSTAQEYIHLIGRDLNTFQSAQALQYQKEVRPKEQQIQQKAEELQALTLRIQALKSEINQLTQDVNTTREQLNTTKNSFLLAGENKQREIQVELQKIAQYF